MHYLYIILISFIACNDVSKTSKMGAVENSKGNPSEFFQVGELAPNFKLHFNQKPELDEEGGISLSSFYGKPVILNFWASWCSPCIKELPNFERLKKKMGDRIQVLTINTDPPNQRSEVEKFLKKNNYTFGVFFDPESYSIDQYRISGYPETFILDKAGKFLEIYDPEKKETTLRVISEREWDSQAMMSAIDQAISEGK